jgi:hypothetical protein
MNDFNLANNSNSEFLPAVAFLNSSSKAPHIYKAYDKAALLLVILALAESIIDYSYNKHAYISPA